MNARRPRLNHLHECPPGDFIKLVTPERISATRFNRENSGASHLLPYPWVDAAPFIKRLTPGWKVNGWAKNADLDPSVRRDDENGGPFIAIMFIDPQGFDVWFHFGDYSYQFIQSSELP